jgi:hypothetical protein
MKWCYISVQEQHVASIMCAHYLNSNCLVIPEVRICPSRLKASVWMGPLWPVSSASKWPWARSHSRTLESAPADARNLPSTEKHREYIGACASITMTMIKEDYIHVGTYTYTVCLRTNSWGACLTYERWRYRGIKKNYTMVVCCSKHSLLWAFFSFFFTSLCIVNLIM